MGMKTFLRIYEENIHYEPNDKIEDLIYLQDIENGLVELGLNIKLSPELQEKQSVILEYIETGLYLRNELIEEFFAFLSFEYKTVAMFMRLSEGRHPSDCLRNLYMKYCREYQKKTLTVYEYIQVYKRIKKEEKVDADENIILPEYIKEVEIYYEWESTLVQFKCESIWIEDEGTEVGGEEVSLFLDEKRMKKAFLTFLNPCLIEKNT